MINLLGLMFLPLKIVGFHPTPDSGALGAQQLAPLASSSCERAISAVLLSCWACSLIIIKKIRYFLVKTPWVLSFVDLFLKKLCDCPGANFFVSFNGCLFAGAFA